MGYALPADMEELLSQPEVCVLGSRIHAQSLWESEFLYSTDEKLTRLLRLPVGWC